MQDGLTMAAIANVCPACIPGCRYATTGLRNRINNSVRTTRMPFLPPAGITFYSTEEVAISDLCALLRQTTAFLQGLQPRPELRLYNDWWEHDGLHFERCAISFHELIAMVETPRSILEATPDEDEVFVGVAPQDSGWYLRFRAEWDADDDGIVGRFAVIVRPEIAHAFISEIAALSRHALVEEPADSYYKRLIARSG